MSEYVEKLAARVVTRVFDLRNAQDEVRLSRAELTSLIEVVANHVIAGVAQLEEEKAAYARKLRGGLS